MSLKSILTPHITAWYLSAARREKLRRKAERRRLAGGTVHEVHYFHQVDDPYSALTAQALAQLQARYAIRLIPHLVSSPSDSAAPERERLVAYSRVDAQRLARQFALTFADCGAQPLPATVEQAAQWLSTAIDQDRFVEVAPSISAALWASVRSGALVPPSNLLPASPAAVAAQLQAGDELRERLGHYLGATFFYGGEWYWGLDRLHYLERRLQGLGAMRTEPDRSEPLFPPPLDLSREHLIQNAPEIHFFVSLRSPYSAIVTPRVFELGRLTGAPVRIRYVLPMVMRGLPVPPAKLRYIPLDTAREAERLSVPFGRLNDPVGRPTERGLAIFPLAERAGKAEAYLKSFMLGVWAEGLDAGSDRGLRRITDRAGLDWGEVQSALKDEGWRVTAEANRAELFSLGLWGVPSFRVGDTAAWGQDRLWVIEQALLAHESRQQELGAQEFGPKYPPSS